MEQCQKNEHVNAFFPSHSYVNNAADDVVRMEVDVFSEKTGEAPAVLLKGRHLKSNIMGLPTAEIMFSNENDFRMANVIVIRTHGHNILGIIDLED